MNAKTKQILRTLLILAIGFTGLVVISLVFNPDVPKHRNSIFNLIPGLFLIAAYQQIMVFKWVYSTRYALNTLAFGLGIFLWRLPDLVVGGFQPDLLRGVILETAIGTLFGLFLGLFEIINGWIRKKQAPYLGKEETVITSKALMHHLETKATRGMAVLLPDRIIFLSRGLPDVEIRLIELKNIAIEKTIGFAHKLVLTLGTGEIVSLGVSMPCFWEKEINELIAFQPIKNSL